MANKVHVFNLGEFILDPNIAPPETDERTVPLGSLTVCTANPNNASAASALEIVAALNEKFDTASSYLQIPFLKYVVTVDPSTESHATGKNLLSYLQSGYDVSLAPLATNVHADVSVKLKTNIDASSMKEQSNEYLNGDKVVVYCQFKTTTTSNSQTSSTDTSDRIVFEARVVYSPQN